MQTNLLCTDIHQLRSGPLYKAHALFTSVLKLEVFPTTDINVGISSSIIDQIPNRAVKKALKI